MLPATRDSERGDSLVEVLVTVVILSLAGLAILAGIELSVQSSDLGRKQASGGTYVRSLAEAIQNSVAAGGYSTSCGNYATPAAKAAAAIPASYTVAQTAIQTWTGAAWTTCAPAIDNGVQRIDLSVTTAGTGGSNAVETLIVIVRKPCSGSVPDPTHLTVNPC